MPRCKISSLVVIISVTCMSTAQQDQYDQNKNNGKHHDMVLALLNGTDDDIKTINREDILKNIWYINKLPLTEAARTSVWEVIKGDNDVEEFSLAFIKELGEFVLSIPEQDLYKLNMSDSKIIEHLGMIRGFSQRQLGVMAYALQTRWTIEEMFGSVDFFSKMNGILCGFSEKSLEKIPVTTLININTPVFHHVTGCTHHQIEVLVSLAVAQTAFGPPSSWSNDDVDILGLLITGLDREGTRKIRPRGMGGLKPDVMKLIPFEQVLVLRQDQIDALPIETLSVYRRRTGKSSGATTYVLIVGRSFMIFIALVPFHVQFAVTYTYVSLL